jgi:hypothetical protein
MTLAPFGGVIDGGIPRIVAPAGVPVLGALLLGLLLLGAVLVLAAWRSRS